MIRSALTFGLLRSYKLKKIVGVFWILNLLTALLLLLPYIEAFWGFFSHRMAVNLLTQKNQFIYFSEFRHYMGPAIHAAQQTAIAGNFLHLVVTVLLSGGLIHFFVREEPVKLRKFWTETGRFAGRMVRLAFLAIFILAGLLLLGLFIPMPFTYLLPSPFVENVYLYFYSGWFLFIGFCLLVGVLIIDLARILTVRSDSSCVTEALRTSLLVFIRHPLQLIIPYLILTLCAMGLAVLYWFVQKVIPGSQALGIAAGFALLQIFIFLQYWIRFSKIGVLVQILNFSMSSYSETSGKTLPTGGGFSIRQVPDFQSVRGRIFN